MRHIEKAFNSNGVRTIYADGTLPRGQGGVDYSVPYAVVHEVEAARGGWFAVINRPSSTQWAGIGHTDTYRAAYFLVWLPPVEPFGEGARCWPSKRWGTDLEKQDFIRLIEEVEPGNKWHAERKRLIARCERLALEEW